MRCHRKLVAGVGTVASTLSSPGWAHPSAAWNHAPSFATTELRLDETYDKFHDRTYVALEGSRVKGDPLVFTAAYSYAGRTLVRPPTTLLLSFLSSSEQWRFREQHDLILLLDEAQRVTLPTTEGGKALGSGEVDEWVFATISVKTLSRLARAKRVEGQLASAEFQLTEAQLMGLRGIALRLVPLEGMP